MAMRQTSNRLAKLKVLCAYKELLQSDCLQLVVFLITNLGLRKSIVSRTEECYGRNLKANRARNFLPRLIYIVIASYCDLWNLFNWFSCQSFWATGVEDIGCLLKAYLNSSHLIQQIETNQYYSRFRNCNLVYQKYYRQYSKLPDSALHSAWLDQFSHVQVSHLEGLQ